jgi:hypothetical protein
LRVDLERVTYWSGVGAQLSGRVNHWFQRPARWPPEPVELQSWSADLGMQQETQLLGHISGSWDKGLG